jgi:transcriptional regulator with XRE-family HTH domain
MTAPKFRAAVKRLGYTMTALAKKLKVQRRTVHRWASGQSPVPETVALLLTCWLREQRR